MKLSGRFPSAQVVVLEKENGVARHQSGNNSGVLHAGLYYKPGSLKARLAVSGIQEMVAFCKENGIRHEICGKLVVAVDETELARLHDLHERGQKNGLQGLRLLHRPQMLEIEPHVAGIAAVHVPQEGIVDYIQVCNAMVKKIEEAGGRVVTRACVNKIQPQNGGWLARTPPAIGKRITWSIAPACTAIGWPSWPVKSAPSGSSPSAASISKSNRRGSIWCAI